MKSKRSKITIIFVVLLIICSGTIVSQSVEPELKEAPLDAYFGVFQKFFNEAVRQKFLNQDNVYLGEVPSPVDRSHVRNVPPPYPRDWYSTSYDLRTLNKLTPIRNQGNCGSCWTFATMASLESYGKPGNDWDFSEQDLNLNNGFDFGECNGGNHDMAAAYLARWSGPLSETAVPYPYSSSSAGFSRGAYLPEKHIQKIIFIPQRSDSLDNDTIKYFISTYGAVHVSFYYDSSYIDAGDLSFYNNVNTNTNHAVAAVGWDDDYSASNFRPDRQPPGNGAFLIRNSWGTGRHDGGYFWLSYYDTSFKPRASLCNAEDPDNYDTNYYYDPLGQVSSAGYNTTTAWGANIFTAQGNSSLKAAGFITNDTNTAYEIYVYKGVTPGEPTSGTLEATATGSRTYPGYYTVTLTSPVSLTQGDLFSVVIKFTNSSYTWPVAIETAINGYSSGAVCYAGESFISSNGSSWTDAYTYDWNVCIKGFASSSYTISGTVSAAAAPVANVVMDGLPGDPLTNGSGFYTADVQSGWSGTVTPTLQGYTFTPPSTTYTGVNTNHTDDYTATTHYITVISPNGGENLNMGSIHDISWTSAGITGNVMIQYSVDGGSTWRWVTTSTENDGNYNWTVPNAPSNQCLVRVSEKDDDGGISDESDAVFTILSPISGSITVRSPNGGENWHCGSSQEITWGSTGDIGSVNIKYSHDNGVTWNEIVKSASNQGSYDWTVPYTPSDKCLVRVAASDGSNDSGPSDVSDQVFSIVPPTGPAIRVTTPNGGEQLTAGYRYTVTWQSFGYRDDVKIEYSTTGGDFWTEITRAATNDGRYDWTVPDEPSDLCLVRVSGAEGEPSDESDSIFSILSQATSDLRVVSPNGGESWEAGSGQTIKWSGAGQYEYVNIKFSKNNGVTWETIVQSTVNDGGHDWVVPAAVSEECLIRVTADSQGDPKPSDDSDALFSIVLPGQPTLKVITPNGGEQLPMGSRYSITWYGTGTREDVKIEYSTNAGDTWTGLIETTPNDGQYDWTVPAEQSDICLVRISEIDGDPVDVSDTVFSIVPPLSGDIVVSYPNGGESWTAGNIKEISWYGSAEINNVTIKYSHDNGSSWQTIVQTTPNDGSYDWTLPATPSDECLVQISANDGDPDPVPSDISDAVFSILKSSTGEFKVTSPNGGEAWEVGSIHPVTWTCSGTINSVMIEYSYNNGGTWSPVVSAVSNSGSYDWPIPYTVSAECLIRITANDGGGDPVPSDVSDEVFSIVLPTSPTIRVITPNGGEEAVIGSVYHITWFSTGFREPVEIEYTTDGGDTWQPIAETENDGEYDWTVPDESSQTCLVRISETSGTPVDVSDTVFSIVPPQSGVITVTAPNGGENLETGVSYDITWTSIGLDNIIIEYSVNNGLTWLYITATAGGSGSYAWTVPATPSENCLVRISGQGVDESSTDVSDAVFTIFDPAQFFIEVITPNGGESLTVDGEYFITWASAGVNDVLIEYSPSNGEQWIAIDTVSALGGRYTWVVPDTPSPDCLVRISDPATQKTDVSDALFTITPN